MERAGPTGENLKADRIKAEKEALESDLRAKESAVKDLNSKLANATDESERQRIRAELAAAEAAKEQASKKVGGGGGRASGGAAAPGGGAASKPACNCKPSDPLCDC